VYEPLPTTTFRHSEDLVTPMDEDIEIHQYVPLAYVRNFSEKTDSPLHIYCLDKITNIASQVDIAKITVDEYFYDAEREVSESIAHLLGGFESTFNAAYAKLLEHEDVNALREDEIRSLRFFMAAQDVRTIKFREKISEMARQLYLGLSPERLPTKLREELEQAKTPVFARDVQINSVAKTVPMLTEIMSEMKWILFVNKTNLLYWTSDHPVCRFNPMGPMRYGNFGLRTPGVQIFFPLNPKLCLAVCDPQIYHFYPSKCEITDQQYVIFQNRLQITSAARHVLSSNADFSLAKTMLSDPVELNSSQ